MISNNDCSYDCDGDFFLDDFSVIDDNAGVSILLFSSKVNFISSRLARVILHLIYQINFAVLCK